MKKKSASVTPPEKTVEKAPPAKAAPPVATAKAKSAPGKPLLQTAVAAAKKFLKSKSAAKPAPAAEPDTEIDATTVVRRTYTRKKKTDVPAILLEGDAPAAATASGPGEKFSLGSTPPAQSFSGGELPEAYEIGRAHV